MIINILRYIVALFALSALGLVAVDSFFIPRYVGVDADVFLPDCRGETKKTIDTEIPIEHYFCHLPKRDSCPICTSSKMMLTPSYSIKDEIFRETSCSEPLDLIHMDTSKVRAEDRMGNNWYIASIDEISKYQAIPLLPEDWTYLFH